MRRQKHTDPTPLRSQPLPPRPDPEGQDPAPVEPAAPYPAARGAKHDAADEGAVLEAIAKDLGDRREIMRQIREAGREAIRGARETTREVTRRAREDERETARQAREVEREVARQIRESRLGPVRDRGRETGEPGTRSRIKLVALELFTENGYEATSLREIAERLGVTKAALYYHFKTKDEILDSLVHDRMTGLDELIVWAEAQPRTVTTRREALRRYSQMLHEQGHHGLMRFFERNQSSMTQHKAGAVMRERMMQMLAVLSNQDAPLQDQIRCSLAMFALHSTWFTIRDPRVTEDQRREAALEVALDLVDRADTGPDEATG